MEILVLVHNLLRWILLPIILFILYRSYVGWLTNKAFEKLDNAMGGAMIGLAHSQLLIGLIIYFSSERGLKLLSTPGVMKDAISRLYALEHPLTMIIAIVLLPCCCLVVHPSPTRARAPNVKQGRRIGWWRRPSGDHQPELLHPTHKRPRRTRAARRCRSLSTRRHRWSAQAMPAIRQRR